MSKLTQICWVLNCNNTVKSPGVGLCPKHYMRKLTHGDVNIDNRARKERPCKVTGCTGKVIARDLCNNHYARWHRNNEANLEEDTNYGKGVVHEQGYIRIHVTGRGYVFEHVLIAEKALGKRLPEGAVVHHLNGIPNDNRPENLVVCPNQAYHFLLHKRQRELNIYSESSNTKSKLNTNSKSIIKNKPNLDEIEF